MRVGILNFSHLDLSWLGTQPECLSQGCKIIATALNEAEHDPAYRFHVEYVIFLDHYLRIHPEELTRLARLVHAGQIEPGSTWTGMHAGHQPGETYVRNILYAKRFVRQTLGVEPIGCTRSDLPGHSPQEPQIFAKSGVKLVQMTRQGPRDQRLFWWRSPDGSRVLTWADNPYWNPGGGYGWSLFRGIGESVARMRELGFEEDLLADLPNCRSEPYLIQAGNDLVLPLPGLLERLRAWNAQSSLQLYLTSLQEFYDEVKDTPGLEVLSGEVPCSWAYTGAYFARHYLADQEATLALLAAERLASLARSVSRTSYPADALRRAWLGLTIAGDHNLDSQGARVGDQRKLDERRNALQTATEATRDATALLAERVHVPPQTLGLVVFNPCSWPRHDVATGHFTMHWHGLVRRWDLMSDDSTVTHAGDPSRFVLLGVPIAFDFAAQGFRILDDAGQVVPYQIIEDISIETRDVTFLFPADVPPLGYRTYYLTPVKEPPSFPSRITVRENDLHVAHNWQIRNRSFTVTVKPEGLSIWDCRRQRLVLREAGLVVARQIPISLLSAPTPEVQRWGCRLGPARVTETGGVRTVVRIEVRSEHPGILEQSLELILYEDLAAIDLVVKTDARGDDLSGVLLSLPTAFENPRFVYGVPYGAGSLDDLMPETDPLPAYGGPVADAEMFRYTRMVQGWVDVGDDMGGLTIASNCRLFHLDRNEVRCVLQLISPRVEGPLTARFRLTPHDGTWMDANAPRAAEELLMPLPVYTVSDTVSPKSQPSTAAYLSLEPANVSVAALKQAEDGQGLIVRLVETCGQRSIARLRTTIPFARARLCDLTEQDLAPADPEAIPFEPYEIVTLRLEDQEVWKEGGSGSTATALAPASGCLR